VSERTRFNFSKDASILDLANFRTSYEDNYVKLPLSAIKAIHWSPCRSCRIAGLAVGITEPTGELRGLYLTHPPPGTGEPAAPHSIIQGRRRDARPMQSPWRVMMIASEPGRLIESNM